MKRFAPCLVALLAGCGSMQPVAPPRDTPLLPAEYAGQVRTIFLTFDSEQGGMVPMGDVVTELQLVITDAGWPVLYDVEAKPGQQFVSESFGVRYDCVWVDAVIGVESLMVVRECLASIPNRPDATIRETVTLTAADRRIAYRSSLIASDADGVVSITWGGVGNLYRSD